MAQCSELLIVEHLNPGEIAVGVKEIDFWMYPKSRQTTE
jgi:hypothetical protein